MSDLPPTPPVPPPGYQYQYGHGPYDQWYGYGPPGVPAGPNSQVTGDDISWGLMCYVGSLIFGILAPPVIRFVKKNRSAFVRFHAAQALNCLITVMIQMMVPFLVAVPPAIVTDSPVWMVLVAPAFLFHLFARWVFLILGTIRASQGRYYRFPAWTCFPMVR